MVISSKAIIITLLPTVAQLEDDSLKMKADLRKILYELRIVANVSVIEMVSHWD